MTQFPDRGRLRDLIRGGAQREHGIVKRALQAVREHLGLQVAYVSEFVGNDSVFREVDAPGLEALIKPGDRRSLDDVYCRHILAGRLPELIPDTAAEPVAAAMPITAMVPIGAHVSVPLRLSSGEVYGMFCCLGPQADPTLNDRDLSMMRAFAELAAFEIERERADARDRDAKRARIEAAIYEDEISIVYQPIWRLSDGAPIGFECLSRFPGEPVRGPEHWFAEAADVGLGVALERAAIAKALAALDALPETTYLAVNASAATLLDRDFARELEAYPPGRIVLELTEHDAVQDFDALEAALAPLRARGIRIAVDDAGAGHSGLQQILRIRPDLIKLDRSLIQGIGADPGRRALASALTVFAHETGSKLIAEGVECEHELAMLRALGVDTVQGYLLGRPVPLQQVPALLQKDAGRRPQAQAFPF